MKSVFGCRTGGGSLRWVVEETFIFSRSPFQWGGRGRAGSAWRWPRLWASAAPRPSPTRDWRPRTNPWTTDHRRSSAEPPAWRRTFGADSAGLQGVGGAGSVMPLTCQSAAGEILNGWSLLGLNLSRGCRCSRHVELKMWDCWSVWIKTEVFQRTLNLFNYFNDAFHSFQRELLAAI